MLIRLLNVKDIDDSKTILYMHDYDNLFEFNPLLREYLELENESQIDSLDDYKLAPDLSIGGAVEAYREEQKKFRPIMAMHRS